MATEIMNVLRGEGKSTECLWRILKDKDAILIVPDIASKAHLLDMVQPKIRNIIDNQIYFATEIGKLFSTDFTSKKIIIDEIDHSLSKLLGGEVVFMTLTDKEKLEESRELYE